MDKSAVDLSVRIPSPKGILELAHPVLPASGTFGYGEEFEPFLPPGTFSAIVPKSISVEQRPGNPPPRAIETPSGLLNSIGLQNPGLDLFISDYLPRLQRYGVPILVNVVGKTIEDYCQVVEALEGRELVLGYELNVSCPNVKEGLRFGLDPEATAALISAVRERTGGVLMAKLTPNVTDIAEHAVAAQEAGADAVSLINTIRAMAVDWRSGKSRIGTDTGGLSGPAIRPVALRMAWEAAEAVEIPVCAIGGISNAEDILEFVSVGASMVQVGTHLYREPTCLIEILQQLRELLAQEGYGSLEELRGSFGRSSDRLPESSRPVR
ncbi:MAG: dihydroorotate dehydrogenase B catalytic subunit [Planctomycetia bacterium TMED53]|nr:MAG: dihydroorotate dehydrogenase B catalytic subunit [Planctomycetia bacterium TMED53]